jgi:hypothetical protein
MRFVVVLSAFGVVGWAAFINIQESVQPLNEPRVISTVILTFAILIQRMSSVSKWLSPRNTRKSKVENIAQQVLVEISRNRTISRELLDLRLHVWEVPVLYRWFFRYRFRVFLKRISRRPTATHRPSRLALRPTLRRVAALGLVKQAPSGVRFRKFVGIVGVCIAQNDRGKILRLKIDEPLYQDALKSKAAWQNSGPEITHRLSHEDAEKLSHSYGQVIAQVVQDPESGEAIGCVTISVKECNSAPLDLSNDETFTDGLQHLAQGVAPILSINQ